MVDDGRDDTESEGAKREAGETLESELERTRKLILERRNRFMAAALAGIGMAGGQACTRSSVCLSFPIAEAGSSGGGAGRTGGGTGGSGGTRPTDPCPGQPGRQPPCVCLSAPMAGTWGPPIAGTTTAGRGGAGAGGRSGSGGSAGTRPTVCLEPPIDEDAGVGNFEEP